MYKNFSFFLRAVLPLLHQEKDLFVVCTGESFRESEIRLFGELGIRERLVHQRAHEAVISQLYSRAAAFVFPSLYEGFGLPVLEAFTHGCPAVLSHASSLPEVGGAAAVYFDPHDLDAILDAVTRVVTDHRLREELIGKGYQQLQQFSWQTTADQTAEVYQSLL
jgi:glycosyltransferase involved in cell wall biosynthesis